MNAGVYKKSGRVENYYTIKLLGFLKFCDGGGIIWGISQIKSEI